MRFWAALLLVLAIAVLPAPQARDLARQTQHLASIGTPVLLVQDRALTGRHDAGAPQASPTTGAPPQPWSDNDSRSPRPMGLGPTDGPRAVPVAITLPRARGPPAFA